MVTGEVVAPMALIRPMTDRYRLCDTCGVCWPADYKTTRPTRYRKSGSTVRVERSEMRRVERCICGRDLLSLPCGQMIRVIEKTGEMHGPEVL